MASNTAVEKPASSAGSHSNDSDDTRVGPHSKNHSDSKDEHASGESDPPSNNKQDNRSNATRHESTATAIGDNAPPHESGHKDLIDTIPTRQDHFDSHDHQPGEVAEKQPSAGRRLYIHHRNKRRLSKQFTPNSFAKHLPFFKHGIAHKGDADADPEGQTDSSDGPAPSTWQNILIMFTTFPYWNMAFWSGWCYSIGSAMFVIDGAWSWVPLIYPETEFPGESKYGVPLWFFFGACLYQIGGVMAYLEAVNDGSFAGAAMKKLLDGHQDIEKELLDAKLHTFFGHLVPHHHHDDQDLDKKTSRNESADPESGWKSLSKGQSHDPQEVYNEAKERVERRGGVDHGGQEQTGEVREYLTWVWWPTWHSLRTYHIFEMGYLACAIQLFGVTLYGVTSIVILPGILDSLEWWQELGAYWVPQVVASCCFLIASIMFTIMAQDKWYQPKWNAVSWWIGIHAIIGSVGFLLCAVFGLYSNDHTWAEFQSSLSSFWGSFFYMLSGFFQWYEAINVKAGPVLAFPNNRTPVLLRKHLTRKEKRHIEEEEEEGVIDRR